MTRQKLPLNVGNRVTNCETLTRKKWGKQFDINGDTTNLQLGFYSNETKSSRSKPVLNPRLIIMLSANVHAVHLNSYTETTITACHIKKSSEIIFFKLA